VTVAASAANSECRNNGACVRAQSESRPHECRLFVLFSALRECRSRARPDRAAHPPALLHLFRPRQLLARRVRVRARARVVSLCRVSRATAKWRSYVKRYPKCHHPGGLRRTVGTRLIGKKYNADGNLVDNPNAKWAISDTTRDVTREIIAKVPR
jgi:hypothetical protein